MLRGDKRLLYGLLTNLTSLPAPEAPKGEYDSYMDTIPTHYNRSPQVSLPPAVVLAYRSVAKD